MTCRALPNSSTFCGVIKMAAKKKVPEIRFKGFDGEWEDTLLSSVANFAKGSGYSKNDLIEYGTPIVLYGRLYTKYQTIIDEVDTFVKAKTASVYSTGNEVIVPASGETAEDISRASAVTKSGIVLGGDLNIVYPSDKLSAIFLAITISTGQRSNELSKKAQGKSVVHLHNSDLKEMALSCPLIDEQSHIGTFFQHIDSLITFHQRKYDKLITVKKAMLQRMFPQDGADVPEIRFKGFAEKWNKWDLGDIYSERNERGNDSLPILSVSIHHGISNGELDADSLGKRVRRSEDKSLYKHVYPGDLVFNMMRAWQGAVGVTQVAGMVSPAYITAIPNVGIFPPFMDCCLRRTTIIDQMNILSYGVTDFRKRLYWESFVRVTCLIPTVSEQQKIAACFTQLDSLITLQLRQLDKLKSIKKACLEKMFV